MKRRLDPARRRVPVAYRFRPSTLQAIDVLIARLRRRRKEAGESDHGLTATAVVERAVMAAFAGVVFTDVR